MNSIKFQNKRPQQQIVQIEKLEKSDYNLQSLNSSKNDKKLATSPTIDNNYSDRMTQSIKITNSSGQNSVNTSGVKPMNQIGLMDQQRVFNKSSVVTNGSVVNSYYNQSSGIGIRDGVIVRMQGNGTQLRRRKTQSGTRTSANNQIIRNTNQAYF